MKRGRIFFLSEESSWGQRTTWIASGAFLHFDWVRRGRPFLRRRKGKLWRWGRREIKKAPIENQEIFKSERRKRKKRVNSCVLPARRCQHLVKEGHIKSNERGLQSLLKFIRLTRGRWMGGIYGKDLIVSSTIGDERAEGELHTSIQTRGGGLDASGPGAAFF